MHVTPVVAPPDGVFPLASKQDGVVVVAVHAASVAPHSQALLAKSQTLVRGRVQDVAVPHMHVPDVQTFEKGDEVKLQAAELPHWQLPVRALHRFVVPEHTTPEHLSAMYNKAHILLL